MHNWHMFYPELSLSLSLSPAPALSPSPSSSPPPSPVHWLPLTLLLSICHHTKPMRTQLKVGRRTLSQQPYCPPPVSSSALLHSSVPSPVPSPVPSWLSSAATSNYPPFPLPCHSTRAGSWLRRPSSITSLFLSSFHCILLSSLLLPSSTASTVIICVNLPGP